MTGLFIVCYRQTFILSLELECCVCKTIPRKTFAQRTSTIRISSEFLLISFFILSLMENNDTSQLVHPIYTSRSKRDKTNVYRNSRCENSFFHSILKFLIAPTQFHFDPANVSIHLHIVVVSFLFSLAVTDSKNTSEELRLGQMTFLRLLVV